MRHQEVSRSSMVDPADRPGGRGRAVTAGAHASAARGTPAHAPGLPPCSLSHRRQAGQSSPVRVPGPQGNPPPKAHGFDPVLFGYSSSPFLLRPRPGIPPCPAKITESMDGQGPSLRPAQGTEEPAPPAPGSHLPPMHSEESPRAGPQAWLPGLRDRHPALESGREQGGWRSPTHGGVHREWRRPAAAGVRPRGCR